MVVFAKILSTGMKSKGQNKQAIKEFIERWTGKGYEKGESQSFWIDLLQNVLNVEQPTQSISFENRVKLSHTSFIDAYIDKTKVLIEQKSIDKDLRSSIKQSDGTALTPFQQAKRYIAELPVSKHPRWVITCNFKSFLIYDMENPQGEPFEILLENLEKDWHNLSFIVEDSNDKLKHEMEVSVDAGNLVGILYDAFLSQYGGDVSEADLHSLNVLCVRLVFCLWAEDSGTFEKDQFSKYMQSFKTENMKSALEKLFKILDTPVEKRDRFLEDKLKAFPYVNGSLFKQQEGEEIPPFTEDIADKLINQAGFGFNWRDISPTIFGAVFESTLNQETRRSGGMHYTSIENIHKVIDPLFMDELKDEFKEIKNMAKGKTKYKALVEFQNKLASLKFLDPACGSGNFLTETFVSLRRLENLCIKELMGGQSILGSDDSFNPVMVNIHQFHGIEINDFAASVATTALWIAESQMLSETEKIIDFDSDFLPLKSYANIKVGNALRIDWKEVVEPKDLSYIIGNPPFVGYSLQNEAQKNDILSIYVDEKGKPYKTAGKIDYVAGWYWKAAQLMREAANSGNSVRTALVSTNSISQGEQVASVWKPLYDRFGIHIDYAWRTFRWDSESTLKAHVHCVIIGFSVAENIKKRVLFDSPESQIFCDNINPYLIVSPNIFVESRTKSICNIPQMVYGNKPVDGGFFFFTEDELKEFLKQEPEARRYIHRIMGSEEYINNKTRYCLWLHKVSPNEIRKLPKVLDRVKSVRDYRLSSTKVATQKSAEWSTLFQEIRQPDKEYIIVPSTSSERRNYIPLGFMNPDVIVNNAVLIIPDATLFHFGILTSSIHMAWMRAVCGRLEMRYRYSKDIVYNNFPWPTLTDKQKEKIEQTAQAILDARAKYPDSSLADLYDEVTMPADLRKTHQNNDKAVMEAYGFGTSMPESDIVAELFKLYSALTK